jgi:hypothetical protein
LLVVIGLGVVVPALIALGALAVAVAALRLRPWRGEVRPMALPAALLLVALGASAALFMLVRSGHDPGVNQGNPMTWQAFVDVVARRQYDVPGLWPRRAPLWIQLANLVQYSDWQVAFGLDDGVAASWRRTPLTIAFGAMAITGLQTLRRRNRRGARAAALLIASASLGVVAVLNLRAGPSIGVGLLPVGAGHEPRERDYFFALAFGTAAALAGVGAASLARQRTVRVAALAAVALAPVALNWPAATRRRRPDAGLANALGEALLRSAPSHAVLLLAGDNDSYAVWHQQHARGLRTDVVPLTIPLLGAKWYRAELGRRSQLLDSGFVARWYGEEATLRRVADAARRQGRRLSASVTVNRNTRNALARSWSLRGMVYASDPSTDSVAATTAPRLDRAVTDSVARRIDVLVPPGAGPAREGTARYVASLLECPRAALEAAAGSETNRTALLASTCNFK